MSESNPQVLTSVREFCTNYKYTKVENDFILPSDSSFRHDIKLMILKQDDRCEAEKLRLELVQRKERELRKKDWCELIKGSKFL